MRIHEYHKSPAIVFFCEEYTIFYNHTATYNEGFEVDKYRNTIAGSPPGE
jgi:hypothetical protein